MKKLFLIFLPYLCFAQTFKGIQITQGTTITYKANQLFESYPNSQGSNPIQNAVPTGWIAWFDPNANITIATGVSQWCDISGTYCLTQATAGNQPTYNSGVRPSLSFNGTTNILSGSGAGLALGTSSYLTVIAVAQLNSISGDVLMNLQSPANGLEPGFSRQRTGPLHGAPALAGYCGRRLFLFCAQFLRQAV